MFSAFILMACFGVNSGGVKSRSQINHPCYNGDHFEEFDEFLATGLTRHLLRLVEGKLASGQREINLEDDIKESEYLTSQKEKLIEDCTKLTQLYGVMLREIKRHCGKRGIEKMGQMKNSKPHLVLVAACYEWIKKPHERTARPFRKLVQNESVQND